MNKKSTIVLVAVLVAVLAGCLIFALRNGRDGSSSGDSDGQTVSAASGSPVSGGTGGGSIHLSNDGIEISGSGMQASGRKVTIQAGGTYKVEGSVEEGQIYIQAGDADEVTLQMQGVSISNTGDFPIHVENAGKLIFVSEGKTENKIMSGDGTQTAAVVTSANKENQISAIHSRDDIVIESGKYTITASGDGIHSNDDIKIEGGDITILCGDDGIHANNKLKIKDGTINVEKSNEGLEANEIEISGGEHSITAGDDGINANGGSDTDQFRGRRPDGSQNSAASDSEDSTGEEVTPSLTISGGTLYVNAQGDGLDSNGNITVLGGNIVVDGPSSNGNGAIDYASENGGVCKISGGTLLALGSSGMAEGFEDGESTQYSFLHNLDSHIAEGVEISILDESGKELIQHKTVRAVNSVVFSCPELTKDKTYTIKAGDLETKVTLESMATSNGRAGGFGGGHGGFGGGKADGDGQGERPDGNLPEGGKGERPNGNPPEGGQGFGAKDSSGSGGDNGI